MTTTKLEFRGKSLKVIRKRFGKDYPYMKIIKTKKLGYHAGNVIYMVHFAPRIFKPKGVKMPSAKYHDATTTDKPHAMFGRQIGKQHWGNLGRYSTEYRARAEANMRRSPGKLMTMVVKEVDSKGNIVFGVYGRGRRKPKPRIRTARKSKSFRGMSFKEQMAWYKKDREKAWRRH